MHSLFQRQGFAIPSLYVKSAPRTYDIRNIFVMARAMSPCLLILEDIDTIVTTESRSYFFNEVDGLENNDGLFMVASTNHLDKLDPGLSSRPSRFDRKYLFPLPDLDERILYCEYWRKKLEDKPAIKFPKKLCPAIAGITDDFSFAYMKEAFVSTLLVIAGKRSEDSVMTGSGDNLDDFELWREMKTQVKLLRDEMKANEKFQRRRYFNAGEQRPENEEGYKTSCRVDNTIQPDVEEPSTGPKPRIHCSEVKNGKPSSWWIDYDSRSSIACNLPHGQTPQAWAGTLPIQSIDHDWIGVRPPGSVYSRTANVGENPDFVQGLPEKHPSTTTVMGSGRMSGFA